MASVAAFYPAQPRRVADWPSVWRGLFGERLRNTIYGWPEPAFDVPLRTRRVLGFTVHIVSDPDAVERIMLTSIGRGRGLAQAAADRRANVRPRRGCRDGAADGRCRTARGRGLAG